MKERPILFNGAMVRAILDGSKTQTRRVMKVRCQEIGERDDGSLWPWSENPDTADDHWHTCPFGQPGNRLWVRETFCPVDDMDDGGQFWYDYRATPKYSDIAPAGWHEEADPKERALKWTPSIHMPRAASRILLEIVSVRVERLNDISEADAHSEGCSASGWMPSYSNPDNAGCEESVSAADVFAELWESINGPGSWDDNPWVWVVKFKRVPA